MEQALLVLSWIWANLPAMLAGVIMLVSGLLAIAVLFPGNQPDAFLASLLGWLNKISVGADKLKTTFEKKE